MFGGRGRIEMGRRDILVVFEVYGLLGIEYTFFFSDGALNCNQSISGRSVHCIAIC
jgi:hypothetical protein